MLITDVNKAFDQAWRVGVFHNLCERGVTGNILEVMWKINSDIFARIKIDEKNASEPFSVEESIRQGSGLSVICYSQDVAKCVEEIEKTKRGTKIGNIRIPAVAWQDDMTVMIGDKTEEKELTSKLIESTKENRIILSKK